MSVKRVTFPTRAHPLRALMGTLRFSVAATRTRTDATVRTPDAIQHVDTTLRYMTAKYSVSLSPLCVALGR